MEDGIRENNVFKLFENLFLRELVVIWGCLVVRVFILYVKGIRFNFRIYRRR